MDFVKPKKKVGLLTYIGIKLKVRAKKWLKNHVTITSDGVHTKVKQRSYGRNAGNYANINTVGNSNTVLTITNGEEVFMVNGRRLTPGMPEYPSAKKQFDEGMAQFHSGMKQFEKSMEDMSDTLDNMFKD